MASPRTCCGPSSGIMALLAHLASAHVKRRYNGLAGQLPVLMTGSCSMLDDADVDEFSSTIISKQTSSSTSFTTAVEYFTIYIISTAAGP